MADESFNVLAQKLLTLGRSFPTEKKREYDGSFDLVSPTHRDKRWQLILHHSGFPRIKHRVFQTKENNPESLLHRAIAYLEKNQSENPKKKKLGN